MTCAYYTTINILTNYDLQSLKLLQNWRQEVLKEKNSAKIKHWSIWSINVSYHKSSILSSFSFLIFKSRKQYLMTQWIHPFKYSVITCPMLLLTHPAPTITVTIPGFKENKSKHRLTVHLKKYKTETKTNWFSQF